MKIFKQLRVLIYVALSATLGYAANDTLVVYSGRAKVLVEPLVERFQKETGIQVKVRYGRDAELVAALMEEGRRSPADVFWANTSGALAAVSQARILTPLPKELLDLPEAFVPGSKRWVPITTRFRVLAYAPSRVHEQMLPDRVLDLPKLTSFKGRIGWTPNYSSFQDFVTALRLIHGKEATRDWLLGMKALEPKAYASNSAMLLDLEAGEIDLALTNHYYVLRLQYGGAEGEYEEGEEEEESGAQSASSLAMHHFAPGDAGNLALVTGAGVLDSSPKRTAAIRFLRFLLSPEAQSYAAKTIHEYPVVSGVELPSYLLPIDQALKLSPAIDPEKLRDLKGTLDLLREAGIL